MIKAPYQPDLPEHALGEPTRFVIKSFANGFIGGLGFALAMYILFQMFANSIDI